MSRWHGRMGRGYMRKVRADKRLQAEIRNEAYQERMKGEQETNEVSE